MEIELTFNSYPKNKNKELAVEIAERNIYQEKEGVYNVKFTNADKDFINLLRLSSGWSTSTVSIDGKTVAKIYTLNSILTCSGDYCENGKKCYNCFYIRPPSQGYRLDSFSRFKEELKRTVIEDGNNEYFKQQIEIEEPEFIIKTSDNTFSIDKDFLKNNIKEQSKNNFVHLCPKYNEEELMKFVDSLPDEIKFKTRKERKIDDEAEYKKHDEERLKSFEELEKKRMEIRLKIFEEEGRRMKEIQDKLKQEFNNK